jgi:hypothetical protein
MAGKVYGPVAAKILNSTGADEGLISLELHDGTVYQGYSFGAKKSIAGELVFQTVSLRISCSKTIDAHLLKPLRIIKANSFSYRAWWGTLSL